MNTFAMNLSSTYGLASHKGSADASGTSAIIHIPHSDRPVNDAGSLPSSIALQEDIAQRFRQCYRHLVGYPADDFQPPAHTMVQYSFLQHFGKQPWEKPLFKAGMAGLGSAMTVLSVGYLLSDQMPNPLASDSLNYTLPPSLSAADDDMGITESLRVGPLAIGDSLEERLINGPSTITPMEFSPSPKAS